jgi:hypothetical protein
MNWIDGGYELYETDTFQFEFLQGYWIYASFPAERMLTQPE